MDALTSLLIGSNGAVVLTLVWLVREVHSLQQKVARLSDDAAYYRGRFKSLEERT